MTETEKEAYDRIKILMDAVAEAGQNIAMKYPDANERSIAMAMVGVGANVYAMTLDPDDRARGQTALKTIVEMAFTPEYAY